MAPSWHELEFHPLANLFPLIEGEALTAFAASIGPEGPENPIIIHEGKILDGRNRFLVCRERGIEPRMEVWDGRGGSPLLFVFNQNLSRRHLGASQRAMMALRLKEELAKESKANMSRGGQGLADLPTLHSRDQAAQLVGVSSRLVGAAERVNRQGAPALIAAVERGEVTLTAAEALLELDSEEQQALVAEGRRAVSVRVEQLRQARVARSAPELVHTEQTDEFRGEPGVTPRGREAGGKRVQRRRRRRTSASKTDTGPVTLVAEAIPEPDVNEGVALLEVALGNQLRRPEEIPLRALLRDPTRFDQAARLWWVERAVLDEYGISREDSRSRICWAMHFPHYSDPLDLAMLVEPPDLWTVCPFCKGDQTEPSGRPCSGCLGRGFRITRYDPHPPTRVEAAESGYLESGDMAAEAES
jgi:hypothetical protein